MNLVDTSGWLEYFAESDNASNYESAILNTAKLLVPTMVIYEVFKKILLDFDENKALIAIGHMKLGKIISIDEEIAVYAAKVSTEKKLPMADSIIYAVASRYNAVIYTQDDHFSKLMNVKFFKKK